MNHVIPGTVAGGPELDMEYGPLQLCTATVPCDFTVTAFAPRPVAGSGSKSRHGMIKLSNGRFERTGRRPGSTRNCPGCSESE